MRFTVAALIVSLATVFSVTAQPAPGLNPGAQLKKGKAPSNPPYKNNRAAKSVLKPKVPPVRSGPVKPIPVKSGQVKSGPVKSGPVKPSPVKSGQVKSSPVKSGQVKSGPVKPSPVKSGQVKSGPVKPIPVKSGQVKSGQVKPIPVKSGPVKPSPVKSGQVKSGPGKSGPVKPSPVKSGQAKPIPGKSGQVKPSPVKSGPAKPIPGKSGPAKPIPGKSGQVKSNPVKLNPVKSSPTQRAFSKEANAAKLKTWSATNVKHRQDIKKLLDMIPDISTTSDREDQLRKMELCRKIALELRKRYDHLDAYSKKLKNSPKRLAHKDNLEYQLEMIITQSRRYAVQAIIQARNKIRKNTKVMEMGKAKVTPSSDIQDNEETRQHTTDSRLEKAKIEAAKLEEIRRKEAARLKADKLKEQARLEAVRKEQARIDAVRKEEARIKAAKLGKQAKLKAVREEQAILEEVRLENQARLDAVRKEQAKLEANKQEEAKLKQAWLEKQARLEEQAKREADKRKAFRREEARLEKVRLEKQARLDADRLEADRREADKLERAWLERQARLEEQARREDAKLEAAGLGEQARLAKQARREEQARLKADRLEKAKLRKDKLEKAWLEKQARREQEAKREADRLEERTRREAANLERVKLEEARIDAVRKEKAREREAKLKKEEAKLKEEEAKLKEKEARIKEKEARLKEKEARLNAAGLEEAKIERARAEVIKQRQSNPNKDQLEEGDVVDRGADTIKLYALLRALTDQAKEHGGRLIQLLGNHETMNMAGDLRYVSDEDIASYGGLNIRSHAFSENGDLGRYLRTLGIGAKVDDTVFFHAGTDLNWSRLGIDVLNTLAHQELVGRNAEYISNSEIFDEHGPLWYRGFATRDDDVFCDFVKDVLSNLKASRMVIGHTPTEDGRISNRCNGLVYIIDVGISRYVRGRIAALEIVGDRVTPLYPQSTM
ncbi:hypothetical protein BASA50_005879 [Batrachochytrium salamandrivorans]|uniref:Calcineurin-like phosphoesterase domain-containing protein n=1 Tax=Batrachochytrium salamandrivorans TaxID=1357716 RepID=A0ABQ8FBF9_9FUNG|nr:hypothetical protein BASA50_005879 [Batrachochytrium salamandrivorans]